MSDRQLIRDVLLRDGSTLRLRTPTPEDFEDVKRFFEELSPESRYLRFHGYGRIDLVARQHVEADGVERVALIARYGDRLVAVAGYDRLREPGAAEVAFAVADDFHGRGAATRLLEQLATLAAERGYPAVRRRGDGRESSHAQGIPPGRVRVARQRCTGRTDGLPGHHADRRGAGANRRA